MPHAFLSLTLVTVLYAVSMPPSTQVLAVAGGATAVAAGVYLAYHGGHRRASQIVVFAEGSQKGLRVPICESLDGLRGQVEAVLHIDGCRLFIAQVSRLTNHKHRHDCSICMY